MTVRILLFAQYRETAGREALDLELPAEATVADALRELRAAGPEFSALPERPAVAVNRAVVPFATVLTEGDEMALLPPVAGG